MNYQELSYKFMRIFRKRNHLIHRVKELDKGEMVFYKPYLSMKKFIKKI